MAATTSRVLPKFMTKPLQIPPRMDPVNPGVVGLSASRVELVHQLFFQPAVKLINSDFDQTMRMWTKSLFDDGDIVTLYQWIQRVFFTAFGRMQDPNFVEFAEQEDGSKIVGMFLSDEDREYIFRYATEILHYSVVKDAGVSSSWMSPWLFIQLTGDMAEVFTTNQEKFLDVVHLFPKLTNTTSCLLSHMDYAMATRAITQYMNESFLRCDLMDDEIVVWDDNAVRSHRICWLPNLSDGVLMRYSEIRQSLRDSLLTYSELAEADFSHMATFNICIQQPAGRNYVELELLDNN